MSQNKYPVVIIGGGPAGLAAAMQLARQDQQALVLERTRVGGTLWNANLVENYPGFVNGISGPDLVHLFQEQAQRLGVQIALEEVKTTGFAQNKFRIVTADRKLKSRYLVAATGTIPRQLDPEQVDPAVEDRVLSEIYPLRGCQGAEILIIGAGDAAFDYALNLSRQNRVTILNRGKKIKSLPLLVRRAAEKPTIEYHQNANLKRVSPGDDGKLLVTLTLDNKAASLTADYLIAAVGREPDTSFLGPGIIQSRAKLIQKGRLYLLGDLVNGSSRQTAIAVGDGVRAAMRIGELLRKEKT